MKKIIALILMITTLVALTSCIDDPSPHQCDNVCEECGFCTNENCDEDVCKDKCEGHEDPVLPPKEPSVYETLSSLVKKEYSEIVINILTNTNGIELTAEYILTDNYVEYSIEQLSKLPEDGSLDGVSSSYKITLAGNAVIKNGEVVKLDGNQVSLPEYDELKGSFDFSQDNFKNVNTLTHGVFTADVISPSKFFGTSANVKDVKVVVEYSDTALKSITINYKTDNSIVKLSYKFTK